MRATPNKLATATSAYLKTAEMQPVDWLPWGQEAFEKAKAEDKPILLDIGAVWCHWCHVMDHESYEDARTAEVINRHFVPVKVDRDERPDVDARYQKVIAAMTGQGGWPLTAFLTSDGQPFYGGTYFPPEPKWGRPSFTQVLEAVASFYRDEREKALHQASHIRDALEKHARTPSVGEVSEATLASGLQTILAAFDPENGGFGTAPKFPHTGALGFLLARHRRTRDLAAWNALEGTLVGMGNGGVYDQVGGGFHRYSVDAHWIVPHFEKLLYDNAELLKNYAHAHAASGERHFLEKARHVAEYLATLLQDPGGGFRASQDADVGPHDDGDYFTWTVEEAQAVLTEDEWHVARLRYDIHPKGEMHHNPARNVLFVAAPTDAIAGTLGWPEERVETLLASANRKLLEARSRRTAPYVDPTLYANWNGMAIGAFLDLAGVSGDARYRDLATKALDRFLAHAYDPARGFAHSLAANGTGPLGLLDDNVHMADALLVAFNHTQEARYLDAADAVGQLLLAEFFDAERGALRDTARTLHRSDGVAALASPEYPGLDQPTPAPNAVAVLAFDRLARLTGRAEYRAAAERILATHAGDCARHGLFSGTMLLAMDLHLNPASDVLVLGPRGDARVRALQAAALAAHAPNATVRLVDPQAPPATLPEAARERLAAAKPGEAAALVCEGFACSLPLSDPVALKERLTRPA